MCLDHIIANKIYHSSMPYPLYLLPHVSSNNVGHLEFKNLSADLFFWSTNYNFWNLGTFNIPLERSWKYLSNGILHAPKISKITVAKEKQKICSCLATVDQSGQKNHNGETIAVFFHMVFYYTK